MKIRIFQSDKGDCLLLEGSDGTHLLCDGGMSSSMRSVVRKELGKLRSQNIKLEYVYVSHIDQDHISGVLALLEDELAWRLYDHHKVAGTPKPKPTFPRPPEMGGIWHNAFRDQVGENSDRVEDLLATASSTFLATGDPDLRLIGSQYQQIALSIGEALKVSRLASADLLKIPTNVLPGTSGPAKLLMARKNQPSFAVGSMTFTIIGPRSKELEDLKKGWNTWLESVEGEKAVSRLRQEIKEKIDAFGTAGGVAAAWNGIPSYKGVTPPNVASLMFMVDENGKRLLLTGDSHGHMIVDGLKSTGLLTNDCIHVDVLKVQHHGATANLDSDFAKQVSADHYIFCGNGEHGNPEIKVIDHIYNSRLGPQSLRALDPRAAGRKFKFWFSTDSATLRAGSKERKAYDKMTAHVKALKSASGGKLLTQFNPGSSITLSV